MSYLNLTSIKYMLIFRKCKLATNYFKSKFVSIYGMGYAVDYEVGWDYVRLGKMIVWLMLA